MRLRLDRLIKSLMRKGLARVRELPDFIIIGAQRCGTTSLYEYLCEHPCIQPASKKEVHYFDLNYEKGHLWYQMQFPVRSGWLPGRFGRQCHATGEASPYYIYHPRVPRRVAELLPRVKLIALLRNPVERAYSHYHHLTQANLEHLPFEEAIAYERQRLWGESGRSGNEALEFGKNHQHYSYLSRGLYAVQLENWLQFFPRENIFILKSESFFADPQTQVSRVLQFLSLPDWRIRESIKYNRLEYPKMAPATREYLSGYFRSHNERLSALLDMDFDW
jgi:hypothetical protein